MSEEATTESVETEAPAAEATPETPTSERVEDLPEFAQKLISKLRDEAKSNRLKGKEAAEKAIADVTTSHQEELTALTTERESIAAERDSMKSELARLRVALNAGVASEVASEFASRLKGDTEEELAADAARLSEIFQTPSKPERKANPAQGQHLPLNGDPLLNMITSKLGIA